MRPTTRSMASSYPRADRAVRDARDLAIGVTACLLMVSAGGVTLLLASIAATPLDTEPAPRASIWLLTLAGASGFVMCVPVLVAVARHAIAGACVMCAATLIWITGALAVPL